MRDLARGGSFQKRKLGASKRIYFFVFLFVVTLISYLIGNFKFSSANAGDGSIVVKDAPANLKPVSMSGITKAIATGVELTTGKAILKDVRYGNRAKAEVTRAYGAGIYKLDVQASLPDPVNVSYAFWLVGNDGVPVLVDYLKGDKTEWTLNVSGADKFSKLDGVLISLERTKDSKVEEKIMEGSF